MANKVRIWSTLACDQLYTNYGKGGGDLPIAEGGVLIKGGAGVLNDRLITPQGVSTEVEQDHVEYLLRNSEFMAHQNRGFIKIDSGTTDEEAAVGDMMTNDEGRQLTEDDMTHVEVEGNRLKISTSAEKPAKSGKK